MRWDVDPVHSTIGFAVKHMMVATVHGRFGRVRGTLELDPAAPEDAKAELVIDAASVDTNMPRRDEHLRSADFFDARRFPEIPFRTTEVHALGGAKFRVDGELTIRDVTRPVTVDAELSGVYPDAKRGDRIGISFRSSIDRTDFGLGWNQALEAGGVLVGDIVRLEVELAAVRQAEALAA